MWYTILNQARRSTFWVKGGGEMHIQESGEMYLETIYRLLKTRSHVRAIDVGEYMG